MEFIGRRVRKAVGEGAAFCGYVRAFEPESGVFKNVYDDGDLVEGDLSERNKLMEPPVEVVREVVSVEVEREVVSGTVEVGESPRKRAKSEGEGELGGEGDHLMNAGGNTDDLVAEGGGSGVVGLNLNGGLDLDLNDDGLGKFDNGGDEAVGGGTLHGLDLNDGVNMELNGDLINDVEAEKSTEGKKDVIDLNVDVNEDEDLGGDRKRQRFDLNIELPENDGLGGDEQMSEEFLAGGGDRGHNLEKQEENLLKNLDSRVENGTVAAPVSLPKGRGRKRKTEADSNVEIASEMRPVDVEAGKVEVEPESRDETPSKVCDEPVSDVNFVPGSASRGRRARKKTEVVGNSVTVMATPDTGLRRSSRRAKSAVLFGHDTAPKLDGTSHQLSPPTISVVSDKKVTAASRFRAAQCTVLPAKVELPCPSSNLDLHGVSPFDLLSVYAFLRSFSTLLFLSPFGVDDFVKSVKCTDSTLLFDSVHVALLRILRKHLQSLSNQGSSSAINCLRSLNWDHLDLITWPMFVSEYLLLHNPVYIPGLDLHQSTPFKSCFYKLPVSAKIDILRHLCDDVVEAEAFRSEINRRMSGMDRDADLEQNKKFNSSRKRKALIDVASTSCVTEDDDDDGNSDECCLCKMDGNLICCDGCPAAFHARCVGVVCSVLPEGKWYCPECLIGKDNPWLKMGKASRGADLLGIDAYGRRYYSSCGYLLVSELCEDKDSYWSYNMNDIPLVVEALESPPFLYEAITRAISKHWNIIQGVGGSRNDMDSRSYFSHSAFPGTTRPQNMHLDLSNTCMDGAIAGERPCEKSMVASYSCKIGENITAVLETGSLLKMENQVASSEGSGEVSQASTKIDNLKDSASESLKACPEIHDDAHILVGTGNHDVIDVPPDVAQSNNFNPINYHGANYFNYYQFAYEASLLHEELASKSSGKSSEGAPRSIEDIVAGQAKAISNRFSVFSWSNIQNSSMSYKNEKCGWCFYCQVPEMEKDCLLLAKTSIPAVENFTSEALGFGLRKNRENHLIDVMCHMICIEDHLQGLLLGPWSNAHHSMLWRSSVAGADDVASLKGLLLMMESNLHHLAFSAEWRKHVDSVTTMGSASHVVRNYPRAPPKHGIERRTGHRAGLSLFWWRGGSGSRKLFNWKALPHSLASKAARQGGLQKIPGVVYPESGDIAKRTKCDVWRAAVESSRSVDQLALQIRELDAVIKWDEIWNANGSLKMDKNSKKSVKSFKKAVVRKKSSTGSVVRYLLDFGKRRTSYIPDVVLQHGALLDDSSSDKKKYWLEESFVPLHLMKVFEEKMIARKSNKPVSSELREISGTMVKPVEKKGFAYLFSKAERLEKYQCGHCNKDVLVREAVSCEHCKGYFHKKHVRKASGSVVGKCAYTCHKCFSVVERKGDCGVQNSNNAPKGLKRLRSGKGKKKQKGKHLVQSKNKTADRIVVPLRRSARYADRKVKLAVQTTKVKHKKRGRKPKASNSKKIEVGGWKSKKTRATTCSSYWLKGLQLSKRPDDERLLLFKKKKLMVLSGEATSRRKKPACCLCGELEYSPQLNYLACEACGVWFHGDALDLSADKIENLIGFKCHKCLDKSIPVCPHSYPAGSSKSKLVADFNLETECSEEDL